MNLIEENVIEKMKKKRNSIEGVCILQGRKCNRPNMKRRSNRANMKKDFICYYCEKPGHHLRLCNKLKSDKEKMKELKEGKDKLEEDIEDEGNFGIGNDVHFVGGRKETSECLIQIHVFVYAAKRGHSLTTRNKKTRWNLLKVKNC